MKWKPVYGIQKGSPAEAAGFQENDIVVSIDGKERGDLLTLDQRMTRIARDENRDVSFVVKRGEDTITLNVRPRLPRVIPRIQQDHPIAIDSLGLAIKLSRVVDQVVPGSPAAEFDINPGDELVGFQCLLSDEQKKHDLFSGIKQSPLDLVEDKSSWGELNTTVQQLPPGSEFKLTFKRNENSESFTMQTRPSKNFYLLTRGIILTQLQSHYRSDSWSDAAVLGAKQTWSDAGRVLEIFEETRSWRNLAKKPWGARNDRSGGNL